MFRICISVAVFVLAFAQLDARAQTPPPEHIALAREVVVLSGAEANMRQTMDTMRPIMRADLTNRGVTGEQADRYIGLFVEEFMAEVPRMLDLSALAYAGSFSVEELQDMRAFFQTPTGRALAERMPEVTAAMTRAGALIGEEVTPRVVERFMAGESAAPS